MTENYNEARTAYDKRRLAFFDEMNRKAIAAAHVLIRADCRKLIEREDARLARIRAYGAKRKARQA